EMEFCLLRYVPGEWWAGLWDFPRTKIETDNSTQEIREFLFQTTGLKASVTAMLGTFRHSVTRYRITLQVFLAEIDANTENAESSKTTKNKKNAENWEKTMRKETPAGGEIRWVSVSALDTLPLCTTGRKIVKLLEKMEKSLKK
ncbi:MAG: NUDIX domain-containing protein, partial [Planctomycetia bacterium]|nr:NUDIX domain-containing protein [Planctomycetia bacterium]